MTAKQRLIAILGCAWIAFPDLALWLAAHPQPIAAGIAAALATGPVVRALARVRMARQWKTSPYGQ